MAMSLNGLLNLVTGATRVVGAHWFLNNESKVRIFVKLLTLCPIQFAYWIDRGSPEAVPLTAECAQELNLSQQDHDLIVKAADQRIVKPLTFEAGPHADLRLYFLYLAGYYYEVPQDEQPGPADPQITQATLKKYQDAQPAPPGLVVIVPITMTELVPNASQLRPDLN